MVERVRSTGIDSESGEEDEEKHEGSHPGVLQGVGLPALVERARFTALGEGLLTVAVILCLSNQSQSRSLTTKHG